MTNYPPAVRAILGDGARLAALGPGSPDGAAKAALSRFDPFQDLGPVTDRSAALACHAGLWLYHDFLDESHTLSQDLTTPEGSFWHAVMHRREPDAWNSKYWFRKIGPHPVWNQLLAQAPSLGYNYTNPSDFVDFCERVRGSGSVEEQTAKRVQLLEWQLLFDHCFRKALE